MTPPVQEHALEVGGRALGVSADRGAPLSARGVALLGEAWAVLAVAWGARLAMGTADPAAMLFSIVLIAGLVLPDSRVMPLFAEGVFDLKGTAMRVVTAFALTSIAITLFEIGEPVALLAVTALSLPTLLIGRSLTTTIWRRTAARALPHRVAVVGGGDRCRRALSGLRARGGQGLEVVGVVAARPTADIGARHLGGIKDLPFLVRSGVVDRIIVADVQEDEAELTTSLRAALTEGAEVWVVPQLPQLPGRGPSQENLLGLPIVRLTPPAEERASWVVKLAVDRVAAALGLILLAPMLGAIALLIYVDSGRPILLRQTRVGRNGHPFTLYKFRTMYVVPEHLQDTEWSADDTRVTRVGRILRNLAIDELPQLLNILRGQMSLVGPRPERPYFAEKFSEHESRYDERHRLPVGLTGLAQINGLRGDTSIEDRVFCDNYYIDSWCLEEDLKIMIRTVGALVKKG